MKAYPYTSILLTGGHGFLGRHVYHALLQRGVKPSQIFIPDSTTLDLRKESVAKRMVKGRDLVIHLAARVGGIGYNMQHPGELFYDNALMGLHLMEQARKAKVKKFVSIGTVCSYPKFTPTPFKEDSFWDGYPEETNAAYGLAKKMLLVQGQAYAQQYGFSSIYLVPVNMYGPGDHFEEHRSHVIPALIAKIDYAIRNGEKSVKVWGSGKATREFLYVADAAVAIVKASEKVNTPDPINLGSGQEMTINLLAQTIGRLMKYNGEFVFDSVKPDGQPRRNLDTTRAQKVFGFNALTSFEVGLQKTISDFYTTP